MPLAAPVGIVQKLFVRGAVGRAAEVDRGLGEGRAERTGQLRHPGGVIQDELDGLAQLFAMVLGHLEGAEGMGVGVARAAGDEQRDGTGVVGLDAVLGVAGEIGGDLHHVGAERRVVAGIAEDDGQRLAVSRSGPGGSARSHRSDRRGSCPA